MTDTDRRSLLKSAAAAAALGLVDGGTAEAAPKGLQFGPAKPFSFDLLKAKVRKLVREPYVPPRRPAPDIISKIDYAAMIRINFDVNQALYAHGPGRFPVCFFHLAQVFPVAVSMHVVEAGHEREIIYDSSYFLMPPDSPAQELPKGVGFAGVRVQEARDSALDWRTNDWIAFAGSDYFRAIGALRQYGLSCRAIALDVAAAGRPEEFPDFTHIYIDESGPKDGLTFYAVLEGPSIVGVCKMEAIRGKGVIMNIEQMLCLRRDIARFGVAPLTSMYWFSETFKPTAVDWRPEIHDSDGLAMWTGKGERIWRPLNNAPRISTSAFLDENPRGFGLMQRDRNFDHYLDNQAFYDRRPSLWVEPKGQWGKGSVQLVEIPTDDEIHDNIVAMWVPEKPVKAGMEVDISYSLYWLADEPHPSALARCVATRLGHGGQPGQPRPHGVRKFMVEFVGDVLATLPAETKPEAVLWTSRGSFSKIFTGPGPEAAAGHWQALFDLTVTGAEPVEMRLFLRAGDKPLSETWLFQYHPWLDCQPSCYPKPGL